MHIEQENGVVINHKKIRRIMRKYGLVAKVRHAHPNKQMVKKRA
jgi:putative transposase